MDNSRSPDPTDSISTGLLTWTRDGETFVLSAANAAALASLRTTSDQIIGSRLSDVAPALASAFESAMQSGAPANFEYEHRFSTSGEVRKFLLTLAANGDRLRVYITDHTETAAMRRHLDESESRYRALFEQSPAGVLVFDRELVVTDCNARFAEILAISRETLVGFDLKDLNDKTPLRLLRAALSGDCLTETAPYRTHYTRRDLVLNMRVSPLRSTDGAIVGGMVQIDDETDERRAAARLRAQFDAIPVPTFAWQQRDRDGTSDFVLIDFNAAADRMGEGRIRSLAGKWLSDGLSYDPTVPSDMHSCLREGRVIQRQIDHTMNTTGARKVLLVTYSPVPPDVILTHTEDVTLRLRLEEQLREAHKMEAVGRLAGGIAHDFNNVLTVIDSYCSLLKSSMDSDSPLRDDVTEIRYASERAASLTRQLLAFSRKQVLRPQSLNLNKIVSRIGPMLRRLIGDHILIVCDLEPELGSVVADPGQIEQVLVDLAVNARDSMADGGTLTFKTFHRIGPTPASHDGNASLAPTHVVLAVEDTGVGMDDATRTRIFEPFFTTREPGRGSGLGLSTVHGIVEQSGGLLTVESEPDKGTRFEIQFPIHVGSAEDITPGPTPAEAVGGDRVILIAEDEERIRNVVRRVLEPRGFRVLVATDGRDALHVAAQFNDRIDFLITDLMMPEMGGRALSDELVKLHPELRVLYMSGFTDDEFLRRGQLPHGASFLPKPFSSIELLAAVAGVAGQ